MKPAGTRFDVAVFPITNAVLFPGTVLPLHIMDERYCQMLQDVRAREWPIAVSLVDAENGLEAAEHFKLNPICGAGIFQVYEEDPEKQELDILVHGLQRVRLHGFVQQEPYFIMEAEALDAESVVDSADLLKERFVEFQTLVKTWVFLNPDFDERLALVFDEFTHLGELCDFFVFYFLKKVHEKQSYLNCTDPLERAEKLGGFLQSDLLRLIRKVTRAHNGVTFH